MDGNAVAGAMTAGDARATFGRVAFSLAGERDDADLRRLLRENPMPGPISVSLEREPSIFHAAGVEGEGHQILVARQVETAQAIAMGSVAVRERFVNGSPRRVGYLGQLRLDRAWRGRGDVVRAGYRFLRKLHEELDRPPCFTSIVAENRAARRLLEAGLPGMPKYHRIGAFTTTLLMSGGRARGRPGRGTRVDLGSRERLVEIVECLDRNGRRYQFHPRWTAEDLTSPDRSRRRLRPEDFHVAVRDGRVVGCLATWSQEPFKQIVVRGYSRPLRAIRPLLNVASRLTGGVALPPIGSRIPYVFISHVAVDGDDPEVFGGLLSNALASPAARGRVAVLGFSVGHPLLAGVRDHYRCRAYDSILYTVAWDDAGETGVGLDGRVVHPEVALL